jgi:hypothetical protein
MSARKWPIYWLEVGKAVVVEKPPKQFLKVFRTKRIGEGREVRRVA